MIEFFSPNARAFLPTFRTNCPEGSHLAQKTVPNPIVYWDMYIHKTPPTPPKNTLFPGPELESGQNV